MGLVATYPMQGGQPSRYRNEALRGAVSLPWGGPTDQGGDFPSMMPLQNVGGTAQPEIWTLTLGGTGNVIFQFGAQRIYASNSFASNTVTAPLLAAALFPIWPIWALPVANVTGGTGGPFTITFGKNARIGGLINFVRSGTATASLVRTQRGSCGSGQYDYADGVTNTNPDSFLVDTIPLGPTGDLATDLYGPVSDTTFSPWAWIEGFFFAADIPLLTDAEVASSTKINYYIGTSVSQPGCEIRLIQA